MTHYLRYLKTVLLHKWYVLVAGRRLRVPLWRLLVHDLSEFSLAEFSHYARNFCGDKGDPAGFERAWLHHKNRNDHHWEWWLSHDGISPYPMPMIVVREMVADWFAAGKAYNGAWPDPSDFGWYVANRPKMKLHPDTEMRIGLIRAEAAKWKWKAA